MTASIVRRATGAALVAVAAVCAAAAAAGASSSPKPPSLNGITLSPADSKISLLPQESLELHALATYSDKSTQDVTARLVFTSSKPEIAAIDGNVVRAIRSGDADVSAVDPQTGKSASNKVKIKVAKLSSLAILPVDKVVPVNASLPLQAIGTYDNGRGGIDLTSRVTWSSSKTKVAQVDAAGVVSGASAGEVKITAFEPVDRVKSSSSPGKVTVVSSLSSIAVEPASVIVRRGQSATLAAKGSFEGGAAADLSGRVDWRSSDPAVASVDAGGNVTAVSVGQATIDASDPDAAVDSASSGGGSRITVLGALIGLTVSPTTLVLPIGASAQLSAFAAFEGQSDDVSLTAGLAWRSSNTGSLSVDPTGLATCNAAGAAKVSFTDADSGRSTTSFGGDAVVTCVASTAVIRVSPAKKLVAVGKKVHMQAFLVTPDGTERELTGSADWTASDPTVASIVSRGTDAGLLRALKAGVVKVVASDPATRLSSSDVGGTVAKISVAGTPKVVKIFPKPNGSELAAAVGVSFLLKARVDFVGGATQGANNLVRWSSSNAAVLKVSDGSDGNQAGWSTPLRAGSTTVTIEYPNPGGPPPPFPPATPLSASVKIRVTP